MLSWVLALVCLTCLVSAEQLKLKDCNKSGKPSHVQIRKFDLSPQPVPMPGKVSWDVVADLNKNLTDVSMKIQLIQLGFFVDLTLPCKDQIGSCEYPRMCSFVQDMISENWGGIGADIGKQLGTPPTDQCKTGLAAQTIASKSTVNIPKLPALLQFIAEGDYTIRVEVTDNTDNSVVLCTEASVTLGEDSSIWGKRRRRRL